MYVYIDNSYMLYVFYNFDLVKVIFFSMIYTWFIIALYMYVYVGKLYILYIFYNFDLVKVIFFNIIYT